MTRVAAFDCGTNTVRLLVAEDGGAAGTPDGPAPHLRELRRRSEIVRLGEGIDRTGRFAPQALARLFAALDSYAADLAELSPDQVRFVATSASRDAANADELVAGVHARIGVDPDIVPGTEEAGLSFLGATASLSGRGLPRPTLVVDMGGGSTEFVLGDAEPRQAYSADIGSVRLTERHVHGGAPMTTAARAAVTADVEAALDRVEEHVDLGAVHSFVGVSGSVTAITMVAAGLQQYDRDRLHGLAVPIAASRAACERIVAAGPGTLRSWGLAAGRAAVAGAAAVIWDALCARIERRTRDAGAPLGTVLDSEHDILDGIALRLLRRG
ncbi:MAG: exopolyphosphatase [Pseudoclavibacter sp.]